MDKCCKAPALPRTEEIRKATNECVGIVKNKPSVMRKGTWQENNVSHFNFVTPRDGYEAIHPDKWIKTDIDVELHEIIRKDQERQLAKGKWSALGISVKKDVPVKKSSKHSDTCCSRSREDCVVLDNCGGSFVKKPPPVEKKLSPLEEIEQEANEAKERERKLAALTGEEEAISTPSTHSARSGGASEASLNVVNRPGTESVQGCSIVRLCGKPHLMRIANSSPRWRVEFPTKAQQQQPDSTDPEDDKEPNMDCSDINVVLEDMRRKQLEKEAAERKIADEAADDRYLEEEDESFSLSEP